MRVLLITLAGIIAWSTLLLYSIHWEPSRSVDSIPVKDLFEDPPLGVELPLPEHDVLGRPLKPRPKFAVFMGDCESCSIRRADPKKIPLGPKVVFIFQGEKSGLKNLKAFEDRGQCVFADKPIQKILRRIDYVPRAVRLDGAGKIVGIQSLGQTVEEFCAS